MLDLENPYRPPDANEDAGSVMHEFPRRVSWRVLIIWVFVFAANLLVPFMFATSVLNGRGYVGVVAACLVLLITGGWLLNAFPSFATSMLIGAGLIAATQLIPILQMIAGLCGLAIAGGLGLVEHPQDVDAVEIEKITSEAGGFVVTLLVGLILLTLSASLGGIIQLATRAMNAK